MFSVLYGTVQTVLARATSFSHQYRKDYPEEKQLHTHETDRDAIERGENEGMTVPLGSIITPELRANPRRGRKSTDHQTPQLPKIASNVHVHLAAS